VVATLNAAANRGLRRPETVKRMQELGYAPMVNSPESFRKLIEAELARWKAVAQEVKLSLD
jgi:tripartite-type tricarboxylate transporter receptor subunit TctC